MILSNEGHQCLLNTHREGTQYHYPIMNPIPMVNEGMMLTRADNHMG